MRVLMIAPVPFDYHRGKSRRVRQSVHYLAKLGYQIDVVTYPTGEEVTREDVTILRASELLSQRDPSIPGFTPRQILTNADLARLAYTSLGRNAYDAIHAHDIDGILIGQVVRKLRQSTVPIVYDMHGRFEELNREYDIFRFQSIIRQVQTIVENNSSYCIANWPHVAEELDETTRTSLILDEPDETVKNNLERGIEPVEPWETDTYVLYTGNYAEYQGVDLLLDAYQSMDRRTKLVLTGNPPDKYILDEESVIYTGYVDEPTLARILDHADVLASPRMTKGFPPMKILYYRLTDNPIVATNRTCHTSVLKDTAGVIFCKETVISFAEGLRRALESEESFDREPLQTNVLEKYEQVYQKVT